MVEIQRVSRPLKEAQSQGDAALRDLEMARTRLRDRESEKNEALRRMDQRMAETRQEMEERKAKMRERSEQQRRHQQEEIQELRLKNERLAKSFKWKE